MDVEIVQARDDVDFVALLAFIHKAFDYMDARIDPPSSLHRMTVETLREKTDTELLFLAHLDGRMVGCMFRREEADYVYVGKVAVDPELHGRGIGKALFPRAFSLARGLGKLALELETRVELIENHRAFMRLGFCRVGESAHEGYSRPTSIRMRALLS